MPRFSYCLNASTIRTTPLLKQISVAARAGYTGIELWHDAIESHRKNGGRLADVRAALDDHGLKLPTTIYLAGWFDAPPDEYPAVLDACKRRIEQAAALGAEHVIASPPPASADFGLGARRYAELLDFGMSLGVKPAMEFLGFVGELNTIEDALRIIEESGRAEGSIVLDPFHVFRGGGAVESIAKLTGRQIAISHFNDAPAEPPRLQQHDRDRVMPGDGHLDLKRYVKLLDQVGYNGFLSLELFREELWQRDPLEAATVGLEKMKAIVER